MSANTATSAAFEQTNEPGMHCLRVQFFAAPFDVDTDPVFHLTPLILKK